MEDSNQSAKVLSYEFQLSNLLGENSFLFLTGQEAVTSGAVNRIFGNIEQRKQEMRSTSIN